MLPLPGIKPRFLSHPACSLTTTSTTLSQLITQCPDDRYPTRKEKLVIQNMFIIQMSGLHHYQEKVAKFFFLTTGGFDVGTPGGTTNIQPLSTCSEACCGLQQPQQSQWMHSTAEDCFFWPDKQGSLHNPTGPKPMGLSPVTKEGRQVANGKVHTVQLHSGMRNRSVGSAKKDWSLHHVLSCKCLF